MEEKNNDLDQLIIQSDKPSGLKKLLLAAAVLLLVLIIIILVTKSLVQPESKPQSSIILPPEPTAKPAPEKTREPLFEEVPIQEEKTGASNVEKVIEKAKTQPKTEETAPAPKEAAPAPKPKAEAAPAPKPVAKPTPKPEKKAPPKPAVSGHYFIQVGAFFRYPPDKKFLSTIEKEGLHYVIVKGVKNGTSFKKVLVGPYPTRAAAQKDLERVKRRINQNAYILKK